MFGIVRKIWNDPVLGKVIAWLFIAAISSISFLLTRSARNVLVLALVLLWLLCIYVYFLKRPIVIVSADKSRKTQAHYPRRARCLALVGMLALPFLTAGFLGWKYVAGTSSHKLTILVANFDGPDPQTYRVTEKILEQLRQATRRDSEIQVKALGETVSALEGSRLARAKGEELRASIVLWGWYAKSQEKADVTVHVEMLLPPRSLSLRQEMQNLNTSVAELESFSSQTRLSKEMTYFVLLTIGLTHYEAGDFGGAIEHFTNALAQSAVPEHPGTDRSRGQPRLDQIPSANVFFAHVSPLLLEWQNQKGTDTTLPKKQITSTTILFGYGYMGTSKNGLISPDFVSWLPFSHNSYPFSVLFSAT